MMPSEPEGGLEFAGYLRPPAPAIVVIAGTHSESTVNLAFAL